MPIPDATPRPQPGLRGIAIVVSAVLALLVDGTATATINTGLPYLQAITASSPDEASWILTAFNAAYYPSILLTPWSMARIGRRRLMIAALVGFSLVSLVLAGTSNFAAFVILRFVQGALLGCVFVPAALLLFTSLHRDVLKFAPPAFVLVSLTGGTLGTVIGGYFADEYGGGSVFLPGCVATLVTAILIAVAVKNTDEPQRELHFDIVGVTLSVLSFGAFQYLANEGERRNWLDDPTIVLAFCVLAVALPAFVLYELFITRQPHVDFRMFAQHRNLAVGGCVNIAVGAVGYSVTILVAFLQTAIAATPTVAGALVLVRLATYAFGVPAAFLLITFRRFDIRLVVIVGAIGSSIGLTMFSRAMTTTADLAAFVGVSLLFGFFFGMMNQPLGALVIGSMPLPLLAAGISIYKLSSPVGLIIATGGMQTVLADRTAAFRSDLAGTFTLGRGPVGLYMRAHHGHASALVGLVAAQAQTLAYAYLMQLFAFIVLAVIPIVLLAAVKRPGHRQQMFERIVAIVDGSPTSQYAVGASITIAREDVDQLVFCITVDPQLNADGVGETCFAQLATQLSSGMLDDALKRAYANGVPHATGKILQDEAARGVVNFAKAQKAGLIVLGLAPRVGILRPFMRSLTDEILCETTIPLCLVRRPSRGKLNRRILVPIVGDALSQPAVTYAVGLAQNFRSTLVFCLVEDATGDRPARRALEVAKAEAAAGNVFSEELLLPREGGVPNAIVRHCELQACDSIVMATHVRGGLPRLEPGSLTEAVVYSSDTPVVIVRAPRE